MSSACARRVARYAAIAPARVCPGSSFLAVSAAVAHTHAHVVLHLHLLLLGCACMLMAHLCMVHGTNRGRTRVVHSVPGRGGFPVQPKICALSEVEAGVNFRLAGGVRGEVAGSLPRRQPGAGTRQQRVGVDTLSLHPEVPDTQFVPPGRGLGIRQSMGWTKVCETAQSGIWVLKGNARARMLPDNLDCLWVKWRGRGAAVRPQTTDSIWDGVFSLWGRVAPLLSSWCARGNMPTGVNLNRRRHDHRATSVNSSVCSEAEYEMVEDEDAFVEAPWRQEQTGQTFFELEIR